MSSYAKKPQNPNNFIIFDFETGGTDSKKNPVTEIAIISIDGGTLNEISRYQALIAPYDDKLVYDPKAMQVTGISIELLEEEGEDIQVVAQNVLDQFKIANIRQEKSAGLKPLLVGHNPYFDINFLFHLCEWGEIKDYKKVLESLLHGRIDYYGNFQPSYMDTWSLGKSWFQGEGEMTDYKLSTLVEKLGVDINNAHRAMNDVISTTEVLRTCLNSLRAGYNQTHQGGREGFKFPI